MENIKIGIIGCGWFGNVHLDHLLKIVGVEVVALISTNPERLIETAKKVPSARLFESYEEFFKSDQELDALVMTVTPNRHYDIEELAAKRGIHLYIEKPIEVSLEKAKAKEAIIKESGIITCVGYQERYNPYLEELKEHLETEKVGVINGNWIGSMPYSIWWRQKGESGGQIVEQSTHIVDMMRYLFGEVKSIYSSGMTGIVTNKSDYDIEDGSSSVLTFESGLVATLTTSCYTKPNVKFNGVGINIYGEKSVMYYKWGESLTYIKQEGKKEVVFKKDHHLKAMISFLEAIRHKDQSLIKSDYSDGLKTLRVTLAANESIASGQVINL